MCFFTEELRDVGVLELSTPPTLISRGHVFSNSVADTVSTQTTLIDISIYKSHEDCKCEGKQSSRELREIPVTLRWMEITRKKSFVDSESSVLQDF